LNEKTILSAKLITVMPMFYYLWALFILIACLIIFAVHRRKKEQPPELYTDHERNKCNSSLQTWLYDSLKMRGYAVEAKIPCGSYEIDLILPAYKIAILCRHEGDTAVEKVQEKQMERDLKRRGWRMVRFDAYNIYRDFRKQIRKIEMMKDIE
jgi:very-short-patch-repair endonuclease